WVREPLQGRGGDGDIRQCPLHALAQVLAEPTHHTVDHNEGGHRKRHTHDAGESHVAGEEVTPAEKERVHSGLRLWGGRGRAIRARPRTGMSPCWNGLLPDIPQTVDPTPRGKLARPGRSKDTGILPGGLGMALTRTPRLRYGVLDTRAGGVDRDNTPIARAR